MIYKDKKISILGCGWLGLPLAKKLILKGETIKGSTTSLDKLKILEKLKIQSYLIQLSEDGITETISEFLEESDILVINIPPKLRKNSNENFVTKIKNLIPYIETSSISKVLFISSTSVYGDTPERIILTEKNIPIPSTEGGQQLVEVEQMLQNNTKFKTTIIRFGGLIGQDRHPVKHLAGKENLENPEAPINLIHQTDCIGIIEAVLNHHDHNKVWGKTLNAVAPFHPTRKSYYTKKAIENNLEIPKFIDSDTEGKIIDSTFLRNELQYEFNIDLY
ncbi:NAD(P)-dependent oxidoreductase [Flavobacterium columnare]|uniref:NAD-dependent epimerase/dehydratase n=1 Tax=Flavobacterium columnare (strain ATCC 49512 / CIP 103533 / TG 44/87) TaxID=1041826 RepID=G8X8S3_FLACA|nr:epimerase [Flavobacterium columnare]AEW86524.1 NAD-dependent epimerase/dehydratase [Flavobacterium columnare ATCC 49512]MBF6653100.1 NAD(P)-dependent oxidoreductase [Flavobacterium columnare]